MSKPRKVRSFGIGLGTGSLSVVLMLAAVACWAQNVSSPSRYVDHDTALKMGGVGNYVSQNEVQAYQDRMGLEKDLKQQLAKPQKTVSLPYDETVVFFNPGEATLSHEGKTELDQIADQVKNDPNLVVMVDGFTDNSTADNPNHRIANQRAETVRNELRDRGVSDRQIKTEAFGKNDPIASNETRQGRAMNRRAEVFIENITETVG